MGNLSPHFSTWEFDCRHCGRVNVDPGLIDALERLRRIIGRPITIVSGYRCPVHNRNVGGARYSQHLYGRAADLPRGLVSRAAARAAGFTGIGYCGDSVVHVDIRPGPRREFPDC